MVCLGRHVLRLGIVQRQHANGSAQHVHCVDFGDAAQKIDDRLRQSAFGHQLAAELVELLLLWQPAVP